MVLHKFDIIITVITTKASVHLLAFL